MPVLVLVGILVIGGALVVLSWDDRVLLVGLCLHTITMAALALGSAGPVMTGAVFVGNATAVAVLGLGYLYITAAEEDAATTANTLRRRRARGYMPALSRDFSAFLQGLSALLAIVVALGLANKPIAGLSEAAVGVPSFIAYWMLAAGLVIIVLNREYLKVGAGLLLMLNGGQVLYLMAAQNLEARLIAASVFIVLALALGVSYLVVMAARLRTQSEQAEPIEPEADSLTVLAPDELASGSGAAFEQRELPLASVDDLDPAASPPQSASDLASAAPVAVAAQEEEQC